MVSQTQSSTARGALIDAEPQLFVTDMSVAVAYYESVLGFCVAFKYGDPPFYAQVSRDGVKLNLRLVHDPVIDSAIWDAEDLLSASITVENVKALFLEFQESGAAFQRTLHTEPWGARTFTVKDPHGNHLLFAE